MKRAQAVTHGFLLLSLVLAMPGCGQKENPEKTATPVRVDTVKEHAGEEAIRYSASIEANQQVAVSFKVNGYVRALRQVRGADGRMRHVQEGDRVSRGTVLAWLREAEFTSRVEQARSQLAQAQASAQKSSARLRALLESFQLSEPDQDRPRCGARTA